MMWYYYSDMRSDSAQNAIQARGVLRVGTAGDYQEIPGLVASGEADVMITEVMEAGYYVGQDSRLAAPLIYEPFTNGQLGILMQKGSEDLLEAVNRFLEEEKASGRLDELAEKYIYRNMVTEEEQQPAA